MKHLYALAILFFFAASCSTIKFSERSEKDIWLNSKNFQKLDGKYLNKISDRTSNYKRFLWQERDDAQLGIPGFEKAIVQIKTLNDTKLEMSLLLNDSLIKMIQLKGVYKNGYFKIKTKPDASFKYGPLWTLSTKKMYVSLTKENNLVLLESNGNTAFLILFPVSGAGDNTVSYFHRID